jgi:hypothetical protein
MHSIESWGQANTVKPRGKDQHDCPPVECSHHFRAAGWRSGVVVASPTPGLGAGSFG